LSEEEYPVCAAMTFAVEANFSAKLASSLLRGLDSGESPSSSTSSALSQVGELMLLQHLAYSKIGLGDARTDEVVDLLREYGPDQGIYGARVSGGGSGGTIAILCMKAALPLLYQLAKAHNTELIL